MLLSIVLSTFKAKNPDLADNTIEVYSLGWERLRGLVGDVDVEDLTYQDAERYVNQLKSEPISESTASSYLRGVVTILKWALRSEYIDSNPFDGIRKINPVLKQPEMFTEDEFQRLMKACPDERWQAIIYTMYTTGLRRGEVLNLRKVDVDLSNLLVQIRPHPDTAETWAWMPKCKKSRTVPISKTCAEYIKRCYNGTPYIFLDKRSYKNMMRHRREGTLTRRAVNSPYQGYNKRFIQIRNLASAHHKPHSLRTSAATNLCEIMSFAQASKILGHQARTLEQHYLAIDRRTWDTAREAMEVKVAAPAIRATTGTAH